MQVRKKVKAGGREGVRDKKGEKTKVGKKKSVRKKRKLTLVYAFGLTNLKG